MTRLLGCGLGLLALLVACDDSGSSGDDDDGSGASSTGAGGTSSSSGTGGTGAGTSSSGGGSGGGSGGSGTLAGCPMFLPDNPWNTDISGNMVHPNSDAYIDSIGRYDTMHPDFGTEYMGAPNGIPYVVVDSSQPMVPINFVAYGDESDPGPYPVPPDAPIEGGPQGTGDRHVLVVENDNCILYELFNAWPVNNGQSWDADSGAIWDLKINATRPDEWTSADAAGLPIVPGLVRYDEVIGAGVINHALRFTVSQSQAGYIPPATHYASSDSNPNLPPMGLRLRMKAGYDCSGFVSEVQVICTALKTYGMFVADNGSDWFLSGAPNPSWDDDRLRDLTDIPGDAFEVVYTGDVLTY